MSFLLQIFWTFSPVLLVAGAALVWSVPKGAHWSIKGARFFSLIALAGAAAYLLRQHVVTVRFLGMTAAICLVVAFCGEVISQIGLRSVVSLPKAQKFRLSLGNWLSMGTIGILIAMGVAFYSPAG